VPLGHLAESYVYTLVPIAIPYQVAYYYTYLLIHGSRSSPTSLTRSGGAGTPSAPKATRSGWASLVRRSSGTRSSSWSRAGTSPPSIWRTQSRCVSSNPRSWRSGASPDTGAHDPLHCLQPLYPLPSHNLEWEVKCRGLSGPVLASTARRLERFLQEQPVPDVQEVASKQRSLPGDLLVSFPLVEPARGQIIAADVQTDGLLAGVAGEILG
jgi:hypothetical protein